MEKNLKKIIEFVKLNLGMILFFLLLALFVAFCAGVLPIAPVVVATGSMEPAISVGDVVLVCQTDSEKLEVGNIIQYRSEDYTVIHRIIGCSDNESADRELITKGDYNNAPDADPVSPEQIEGRVVLVIPDAGRFTLWLHGLRFGN